MHTRQMLWNKHVKGTTWEQTPVTIREIPWSEVCRGDIVLIAGNLVDNEPTLLYGKHTVINPHLHILENSSGKRFTEQWPTVFREVTRPTIIQAELES